MSSIQPAQHKSPLVPSLFKTIRSGYSLGMLSKDVSAGITVGVVALPLALAFAIASGLTPERGLYTSIVAGFFMAFFSGSRFPVSGPTGAFVVIIYSIVSRHGYEGLVLTTLMAGILLVIFGFLRLGALVKYIPYPVTTGFTTGIALLIFSSQMKDFFGLPLVDTPPEFFDKWGAYAQNAMDFSPATFGVAAFTLLVILIVRHKIPKIPAPVVAVFLSTLLVWLLIGLLCIGAGKVRLHYHAYLTAASRNDSHARATMAGELTMIHGVPAGCDEREYLRELQNALLWINFRFYLAPLFWLIVGGTWGPVTLMGYAFLRAWQYWLARYQTPHHRLQSGIDAVLHVLDWVPVRLAGVVYALIGHGEKALPAWFASLGDFHTSQYQVLTRLAQFSLAREPHVDKVETPKAAVSMAKKTSFVVVVVIALLTIYGALV